MKKNAQKKKIIDLYMPPVPEDKVRMCYVDQFLKEVNQFKGLFQCNSEEDTEKPLMIPYKLHRDEETSIFVGVDGGGSTRALLTSKNLTSLQDISGETLCRQAKEVEANCKKGSCNMPKTGLTMEIL